MLVADTVFAFHRVAVDEQAFVSFLPSHRRNLRTRCSVEVSAASGGRINNLGPGDNNEFAHRPPHASFLPRAASKEFEIWSIVALPAELRPPTQGDFDV